MPNLDWNRQLWAEESSWVSEGEIWSGPWGNSEAQWFGSLYPRLHRLLPAPVILEIAPGFGRWTRFLLSQCERYYGVDLSAPCVAACQRNFAAVGHAAFYQNDGLSLSMIDDDTIDLVFSFDSLVHCELDILESYISQILRKLTAGGMAFIHHSNRFSITQDERAPVSMHYRAASVSGERVAALIIKNQGSVLVQEEINWGTSTLDDCITVFGKAESFGEREMVSIKNPQFMTEAFLIQQFQHPYSAELPVARRGPAEEADPTIGTASVGSSIGHTAGSAS